jgi:hypothetical protein
MMATGGFLSPIVNQSLLKGISIGVGNLSNNNSNSNVTIPNIVVNVTGDISSEANAKKAGRIMGNELLDVFAQSGIINTRNGRFK